MKLHRLELTGFGPFRETQRVDFDAYDADGVFLITGRTGAGKSSILDGVSFALYGSVPRYESGERRLRSDHCFLGDPTEVVLEFTAAQRRWRVTRSPDYDRPAKRGGGLTTEKARAVLEERIGGEWVGRAARPTDVATELEPVLGLTSKQFQQVILLAQNQFSRFLLADNAERQRLLRTLFGTRRFEQYKVELDERRKAAEKDLDAAGEQVRLLLGLAEDLIDDEALSGEHADERPSEISARQDAAATALQRAVYRVEARAAASEIAASAGAAARATAAAAADRVRRRHELDVARAGLTALEAEAPAVDAAKRELQRARAAEVLRAPIEAERRAAVAFESASHALTEALGRWVAGGEDPDVDPAAVLDDLAHDIARCSDARSAERDLDALVAEIGRSSTRIDDLTAAIATIGTQRSSVPAERARRETALATARAGAALLDGARERHTALTARLTAARDAETLAPEVVAAEAAHLAASASSATAGSAVTDLLRRRLAGYAGELSRELAAGEPCAVCGSTEHPAPAEPADDAVTDDDLAAAETARDAALADERTAAEAARVVRERRAAARARAGDGTVETITDELAAARRALVEAESAVADADRLAAELAELARLDDAAREEQESLGAELATAKEAHAARLASAEVLRRDVDAARGAHATVGARLAALEHRRDGASALRDARATAAERERALADARADRDERLDASQFDGVDDATAALRSDAQRDALDSRVTAHAAALTATRARLLELELEASGDAPTTADDLAAAERAAEEADLARTAAIAAVRDAENVADRLRDLLTRADDAFGAVAALAGDADAVRRLADTVAGRAPNTMKMELETFVLAAELEEIVAAANVRLDEMSSGRYSLHHSDARQARGAASGLAIEVLDAYTGKLRSPQSLSGGETFLASLALALGLAEVVTGRAGGIRLDTLFIDEGFGSLDPDTLELAMRTLDDLRAGGRTVGVISHVEAMKEQLPAQLVVEGTPDGPSRIRQEIGAAA